MQVRLLSQNDGKTQLGDWGALWCNVLIACKDSVRCKISNTTHVW